MVDITVPASDFILPFQLEKAPICGRLVRLKTSLEDILGRHQYLPPINQFLEELIALSAALASLFKFDGTFTLQIAGDGPVRLMVADITHLGEIRACARFEKEAILKLPQPVTSIHSLFGAGYLTFTIIPNTSDERYQGIVELTGATLSECLHHFFRQSDQLETGITVFSNAKNENSFDHSAAALIIQRMPSSQPLSFEAVEGENDTWLQCLSILGTATAGEMLSNDLSAQDILRRLFWEDGVRIFEPRPLVAQCRCSEERILEMMKTFSPSDIQEMVQDGKISVTCEFCNQEYGFAPQTFNLPL